MASKGEKLSRKQEEAIICLLSSPTLEEAAKAAGITYVTLWRWMQLPEFKEKYRVARNDAVNQAVARLSKICSEAVEVLRDVMNDPKISASSRVTAARTVLEMAVKGLELEDITSRIEALEKTMDPGRDTG